MLMIIIMTLSSCLWVLISDYVGESDYYDDFIIADDDGSKRIDENNHHTDYCDYRKVSRGTRGTRRAI